MTTDTTPLLSILEDSQNGQLVQKLAKACDIDESQCRDALQRLVPEIARRISDHIEDDDDLEELVDILDEEEQVAMLDDPGALFSRNAVQDGQDLLELLYGSLDKAEDRAEDIGPPRGVDEDLFERMMTMAAALTPLRLWRDAIRFCNRVLPVTRPMMFQTGTCLRARAFLP